MPRLRRPLATLAVVAVASSALTFVAHERGWIRRLVREARDEGVSVPVLDSNADRVWRERAKQWRAATGKARNLPPGYVFWEAEQALTHTFPANNPFAAKDASERAALFGGAWIGAEDPGRILHADYQVELGHGATYQLYIRKFWKHGPFRWRFDDMPWTEVSDRVNLLDEVTLRKHVSANWIHAGVVTLAAGKHSFRIELTSERGASGFDAFLLTDAPYAPSGTRLPDAPSSAVLDGFFAFEPDLDRFEPSAIDWRQLNEVRAGQGGYIVARGDALVHSETGEAVRFWGVNVGPDTLHQSDATLLYFARRLAKAGVNLVRFHGRLWEQANIERLEAQAVERLQFLVHALKGEGIYSALSIYFPHWLELEEARHGFAGYRGQRAHALLFFNERFQSIYRGWWKQLLLAPNPHGGRPLAEDPGVALVELLNEDSLLWGTFDAKHVPAPQMALVEKRFGAWVVAKYGSVEAALRAWKAERVERDAPGEARLALLPAWQLAREKSVRARDTLEFLVHLEMGLYRAMYGYLRGDIGYRAAIVCGNWQTADAELLGPLGKYASAAVCDVMDRHGYYGGEHRGEGADYSVRAGQEYADASSLFLAWSDAKRSKEPPSQWPLLDVTYNGKPSMLSEVNWTFPNRFRAELPPLAAAYGRLQGTDAIAFFATNAPAWSAKLGKFSISDPVLLGQFPAAARLFRGDFLRVAETVSRVERQPRKLYAFEDAPRLDPLHSLVGRVEMGIDAASTRPDWAHPNLDRSVDRTHRRVESVTSELTWDWGRGRVLIRSPRAQGAVGALGGSVELPDVRIESALGYASVMVLALDGEPLSRSRSMLVQVMGEATNNGFRTTEESPVAKRILDEGRPPIVVRRLSGGVVFKRPDASTLQAVALDFNGYPREVLGELGSGMPWSPRAPYYVIKSTQGGNTAPQ